MKWKVFEKLIRSQGWKLARHGSQYDIYEHPAHPFPIQVERHWSREIKPGLLKRLMKQINRE